MSTGQGVGGICTVNVSQVDAAVLWNQRRVLVEETFGPKLICHTALDGALRLVGVRLLRAIGIDASTDS